MEMIEGNSLKNREDSGLGQKEMHKHSSQGTIPRCPMVRGFSHQIRRFRIEQAHMAHYSLGLINFLYSKLRWLAQSSWRSAFGLDE